MRTSARAVTVLLAVSSLIAAVGGCDDNDVGVIRQKWTIAGGTDPLSCVDRNASQMRVVAIDRVGNVLSTQFAPCTAFETTIPLDPGFYTIAATFLRADGIAVSRTLTFADIPVNDDVETDVRIDFPPVAFEL